MEEGVEHQQKKQKKERKSIRGLAVPLGEGAIGRTGWLQAVMVCSGLWPGR